MYNDGARGEPATRLGSSGSSATDSAGYVRATVGPGGGLQALHINPHAMYDLSAGQLADACLEAVRRAQSLRRHPGRL
jgi:hypothetical protein